MTYLPTLQIFLAPQKPVPATTIICEPHNSAIQYQGTQAANESTTALLIAGLVQEVYGTSSALESSRTEAAVLRSALADVTAHLEDAVGKAAPRTLIEPDAGIPANHKVASTMALSVPFSTQSDLHVELENLPIKATVVAVFAADTIAPIEAHTVAITATAAANAHAAAEEARIENAEHLAADDAVVMRHVGDIEGTASTDMQNVVDEALRLSSAAWEQRLSNERLTLTLSASSSAQLHAAAIFEVTATIAHLESQLGAALATTDAVAHAANTQISVLEVRLMNAVLRCCDCDAIRAGCCHYCGS